MKARRTRVALGLLMASLLSTGCIGWRTTSGGPPDYAAWQARDARLANVDHWRMNGTIAVSGNATREAIGRITWHQQGERYTLNLRGPFGAGAVILEGDLNGVTVRDGKQQRRYDNPKVALERALGWPVPLDALQQWMIGRPADLGIAALDINAAGQILTMTQREWTIEYLSYQAAQTWQLPGRLTADREGVSVKLIIDEWQTLTGTEAGSSTGFEEPWPSPPTVEPNTQRENDEPWPMAPTP